MLLSNKTAVIYGAGGSLGGAVARALASEGCRVFLTGHRLPSLEKVAAEIHAAGGQAETAIVDGFDENAIGKHLDELIQRAGKIDISFNAVDIEVFQNRPLVELSEEEFAVPVYRTMQTRFLTAKAAAIRMMKQKSGVILTLTATPAGIGYPYTGGFAPACSAVENFSRTLASELGVYGIRVINIRSGGSPDSRVFKEAFEMNPVGAGAVFEQMKKDTMLKKQPPMIDIANTAVFLCSGLAASITGVTVDVTCGTTAALNYRVVSADQRESTFGLEK